MQIDLAAHLEKLLFLHDTVIIPDFGAFVATRTAASVDYAGGSATPPSKTLVFNENLKADDGLLFDDITRSHNIDLDEARRLVQEFVEKTQGLLNQREIVTLPGIGRLYKNYVQKIQFLPDSANFNSESYGLPPLQFSPIGRSREVVEKPAETTATAATSPTPNINSKYTTSTPAAATTQPAVATTTVSTAAAEPAPAVLPAYEAPRRSYAGAWVVLAVVLIGGLAAAAWWWKRHHDAESATTQPATERNANDDAATTTSDQTQDVQPAEKKEKARSEPTPSQSAEQKMKLARQQVQKTPPAGSRSCILVVATLKDQTNVDRLTHQLETAGYQVYSVKQSGFQIGIQFNYRNLSEVQEKIVALQKLTGEQDIWIKKK